MATAKVEISYQVGGRFDGGGSVQTISYVVDMAYNYLSANTWSEPNGRLGSTSGEWTNSSKSVCITDSKGSTKATLDDVPFQSSWGYPFSGLKGKTGTGWLTAGAVSMAKGFKWEFLDV